MFLESLTRIERNARRLQEIVGVLAKYGLADWIGGLKYEWLQARLVSVDGRRLGSLTQETRVRLALSDLGTTFIKLGQVLSTRPDLIPGPLAAELTRLQSQVRSDPIEVVRDMIARELHALPEQLFDEFSAEPLASASIGQVHVGRLANGQAVVVKVQHAGIMDRIVTDLDIMAGLAELAETHVPELRVYQPSAIIRQFRRSLLRELDFSAERRNMETFARNFADDAAVHVPAVFPELCTRRVLTMEYLQGISGTDHQAILDSGVDTDAFASRAANMYLNMILRDGFYHADPHPGNYQLLPGGVVGVIDCGMVGRLDDDLREILEALVRAFMGRDTHEMTALIVRWGSTPVDFDRDALRSEIAEFVADYGTQSLNEFELSGALNDIVAIIRRYHIMIPAEAAMLIRTLVVLEGTARRLSPAFNLVDIIRRYPVHTWFKPQRLLRRMRRAVRDWERLVTTLPGDAADLMRRFRNGTLEIRHEHNRLETIVNRLIMGILTSALFVGSALLWSSSVPPRLFGVSIPGIAGVAVSVVMGLLLVRKITRSERNAGR